jgi:hypothetical protein
MNKTNFLKKINGLIALFILLFMSSQVFAGCLNKNLKASKVRSKVTGFIIDVTDGEDNYNIVKLSPNDCSIIEYGTNLKDLKKNTVFNHFLIFDEETPLLFEILKLAYMQGKEVDMIVGHSYVNKLPYNILKSIEYPANR